MQCVDSNRTGAGWPGRPKNLLDNYKDQNDGMSVHFSSIDRLSSRIAGGCGAVSCGCNGMIIMIGVMIIAMWRMVSHGGIITIHTHNQHRIGEVADKLTLQLWTNHTFSNFQIFFLYSLKVLSHHLICRRGWRSCCIHRTCHGF